MLLAFVLVTAVTALLCWLLFVLASLALPLFIAMIAGQAAWHTGSGLLGALFVGLVAGGGTLFIGQLLFATLRASTSRLGLALLFAAPSGIAGYSAGHGVAYVVGASSIWQFLFGAAACVRVTLAAMTRLAAGLPTSPVQTTDGQVAERFETPSILR